MLEQVESIAYKLGLPQELSRVHNTFHVSNLRKYYADEPLAVPLDELHFDDKLRFVEKPAEIMDREVKRLRQSRVPIVKVRWNSRRGPESLTQASDEELEELMKDQLLPADASPIALSSGYISDSDLEEDDEEDPEEDPADYPADGGDNDDIGASY
ncbi:hypothetical protein Tco_1256061 [Tanacetum coccineum]